MALQAVDHGGWARTLRRPNWVQAGLGRIRGQSPPAGWFLIAVMLGVSVELTYVLGGAARVAPHWFYVPIVVAAVRFGLPGALPTSLAAGLLAGPVVPADVASGAAQSLLDWGSRAVAFVVIGTFITWLLQDSAAVAADELEALRLEHELLEAIEGGQLRLHYRLYAFE